MSDSRQDVLARVKEALGATSLPEVAAAIGESIGAVKSWSARGSVPLSALIRIHEVSKRSLDWLILGDNAHPPDGVAGRFSPGKGATGFAFEAPAGAPTTRDAGAKAATDCAFEARSPDAPAYHGPAKPGQIDSAEMAKAIDTAVAIQRSLGRELAADAIADMAAQIYRSAMAGKG